MTDKEKNIAKIAIGGLAAFVLYKLVMPKTDNSGGSEDPTGNGSNTNVPGATFNASVVAEKLYEAMRKSGTNETAILNALMYVNPTQFAQVAAKFGKRSYNMTTGNQINYTPWTPLTLYPLQVWLENELSESQYNILRNKYAPQL